MKLTRLKRALEARLAGCYTVGLLKYDNVGSGHVVTYQALPTAKVEAAAYWRIAFVLNAQRRDGLRIVWDYPARELT